MKKIIIVAVSILALSILILVVNYITWLSNWAIVSEA